MWNGSLSQWEPQSAAAGVTVAGSADGQLQFKSGAALSADTSLVWNTTSKRLGVGIANPTAEVHIYSTGSTALINESINGVAGISASNLLLRARGTSASPSAVQGNDVIGRVGAYGYGTSNYSAAANGAITFVADEDFTNLSRGTRIDFSVTPNTNAASVVEMTLANNGHLALGTTATNARLTVNGATSLTQQATDAPGAAGYGTVFTKTDGKLYFRNGTGTVSDISTANATLIQSRAVAATAPTASQVMAWNGSSSMWEPQTIAAAASQWTTSGSNIHYMAGNVGIGTSLPTSRLMLQRTDAALADVLTLHNPTAANWNVGTKMALTGDSNLEMATITTDWVGSNQHADFKINTRNNSALATAFKIKGNNPSGPSVQIQDEPFGSIPDARLRVYQSSTTGNFVSDSLYLMNSDSDSGASNGIGTRIIFGAETATQNNNTEVASISAVLDDATDNSKDGSLRFSVIGHNAVTANTTAMERMRLTSEGHLGIGTTNPTADLHIVDSGYPSLNIVTSTTGSTNGAQLKLDRGDAANGYASVIYRTGGSERWQTGLRAPDDSYFIRHNDSANRMIIGPTGNVALGTTLTNANLALSGAMSFNQLYADATGAAGYATLFAKTDGKLYFRNGTGTATDLTAGSGGSPAGSDGQLQFKSGTSFAADSNLFWNNTSKRLGLGTNAPSGIIGISGNAAQTIKMERHTVANTGGSDLTIEAGSATLGATDRKGGHLILSTGTSTGYAADVAKVIIRAAPDAGGVSTADRVPADVASFAYGATDIPEIKFGPWVPTYGAPMGLGFDSSTVYAPTSATSQQVSAPDVPGFKILNDSWTNGQYSYLELKNANSTGNTQQSYIASVSTSGAGVFTPATVFGQSTGSGSRVERMRIHSNGYLGIGTTIPNALLTVEGTASLREQNTDPSAVTNYGMVYAKTDGKLYFRNDAGTVTDLTGGGGGGSPAGADGQLQFKSGSSFAANANLAWNNTTSFLNVSGSGDFSYLGVNGPPSGYERFKSHSNSSSLLAGVFEQGSSSTGVTSVLMVRRDWFGGGNPPATMGGRIELNAKSFSGFADPGGIVWGWENAQTNDTTDRDGYLAFTTIADNSGSGLGTEKMRITSSGNIGIGTSLPNAKLTVEGATSLREQTTDPANTANYGMLYTKTDGKLYFRSDAGTITDLTAGAGSAFSNGGNSFGSTATLGTNDAQSFVLRTNSTTRMTVSSAGDIGIGIAPIAGTQLYVDKRFSTPSAYNLGTYSYGYQYGAATANNTHVTFAAEAQNANTGAFTHTSRAIQASGISTNDAVSQRVSSVFADVETHAGDIGYLLNAQQRTASTGGLVYGLYMDLSNASTTRYGIYQVSDNTNYFTGDIAIGTTLPTGNLHVASTTDAAIVLQADTDNATETDNPYIRMTQDNGSTNSLIGHVGGNNLDPAGTAYTGTMDNGLLIGSISSSHIQFGTNQNVRMTIEGNNGNVGIGATLPGTTLHVEDTLTTSYVALFDNASTGVDADGIAVRAGPAANPAATVRFISFEDGDNTNVGSIAGNGTGGVAYNTTSDRRIKRNIRDTHYTIEDLMKLRVRDYNPIGSDLQITGYIAQELYEVYPTAVTPGSEDVIWQVDYSKMTPLLTKGIQDLYGMCRATDEQLKRIGQTVQKHTREISSLNAKTAELEAENTRLKAEVEKQKRENEQIKNRLERIEKMLLKQ